MPRFAAREAAGHVPVDGLAVDPEAVAARLRAIAQPDRKRLASHVLPGPTGEANVLSTYPRGTVLCLGPTREDAAAQMRAARAMGCPVLAVAPGLAGTDAFDGTLASRRARDAAGHRGRRLLGHGRDGPPVPPGARASVRPDRAAPRRAGDGGGLPAGATCLHRHHGGGRQCATDCDGRLGSVALTQLPGGEPRALRLKLL